MIRIHEREGTDEKARYGGLPRFASHMKPVCSTGGWGVSLEATQYLQDKRREALSRQAVDVVIGFSHASLFVGIVAVITF